MKRILLFGDTRGIPELTARIPMEHIVGIVGSSIRPHYHASLSDIATQLGVPFLIQPASSDANEYGQFFEGVEVLDSDGLICHSYAMLVRPDVLGLVSGHAFNVHFSLLPRNRGSNPVQWALIHGDRHTGVSLHLMSDDFDTGAIVAQERIEIEDNDTWISLLDRLDDASNRLLDRALPELMSGTWTSTSQDEATGLTNPRISPDSFAIDFSEMTDRQVFDVVRAQIAPLSGAYLDTEDGRVHFREYLTLPQISVLRTTYAR